MPWNLTGSYVETCSCELMCPCNLSFDHGATYDFCRVTLVFNIREGQIEGTDIAGLKVAAIADTPKVMTEGNWRLGVFIDDGPPMSSSTSSCRSSAGSSADRWPRWRRWWARCSAPSARRSRSSTTGCATASGSATRSTSRSRTSFRSASRPGEPVRFDGMFHPVGSNLTMAEAKRSRINAFGIQYEGKTGLSTSEFSWAA